MASCFLGIGGWRTIWGWPWRTSGLMSSTPRTTRHKQVPAFAPTTPPSSPAPRRVSTGARPWRGYCTQAGAVPARAGELARTDGDALVQCAIGGTLLLSRPASLWQRINDAPPFSQAKEGKRGE